VAGAKGVVLRLGALGETRKAAGLPQRVHALAAASEDLVWVHLMAHVPDDRVVRRVEDVVERHGEFDDAE
jgi:hypothetical protein